MAFQNRPVFFEWVLVSTFISATKVKKFNILNQLFFPANPLSKGIYQNLCVPPSISKPFCYF